MYQFHFKHVCYHQSHACMFAAGVRRRQKSRWRALCCRTPPLTCCSVRYSCSRCSRAHERDRVALLSQGIAVVLAHGSLWRPAEFCALFVQCWALLKKMWPMRCRVYVYNGQSVIPRIAAHVYMRELAPNIGCLEECDGAAR